MGMNAKIANDLNRWMDENDVTQSDLAALTGVNQSQISRILAGDFKRLSKNVMTLCDVAKIKLESIQRRKSAIQKFIYGSLRGNSARTAMPQ